MTERELSGLEVDILAHLLENGEQRYIEIAEALFPKHAKAFHHDENHFKVVLVRKLNSLVEDDLVQKRILSPKNVRYSIPNDKKEYVAKMVRHHQNIEKIKRMSPEEIEIVLKELEYQKLLSAVLYLRNEPLPEPIVRRKLEELGFDPRDFKFYNVYHFLDEETFKEFAEFHPTDVKLIKRKNVSETDVRLIRGLSNFPWKLVAYSRKHKIMFEGAYKELLELEKRLKEKEIERVKAEFDLSDKDVKNVEKNADPELLKGMEAAKNTVDYWLYIASKKPNAYELFLKHYMRLGYSEERARKRVEEDFKYFDYLEKVWSLKV